MHIFTKILIIKLRCLNFQETADSQGLLFTVKHKFMYIFANLMFLSYALKHLQSLKVIFRQKKRKSAKILKHYTDFRFSAYLARKLRQLRGFVMAMLMLHFCLLFNDEIQISQQIKAIGCLKKRRTLLHKFLLSDPLI